MEKTKNNHSALLQSMIIGLKLLLICAIVAGVVSLVYAVTAEVYEKNLAETKNQAIGKIFGKESLQSEAISSADSAEVVYEVKENGVLIGYCVEIASAGFGGDISMMVGYTAEKEILGVGIVALSETPGLGSKVNTDSFLSQFEGKGAELVLGEDIDGISGATISSKAVTDGVNRATDVLLGLLETLAKEGSAA